MNGAGKEGEAYYPEVFTGGDGNETEQEHRLPMKVNIPTVVRMLPRLVEKLGYYANHMIAYELKPDDINNGKMLIWFEPRKEQVDRMEADYEKRDDRVSPRRIYRNVRLRIVGEHKGDENWIEIKDVDYEEAGLVAPEEY